MLVTDGGGSGGTGCGGRGWRRFALIWHAVTVAVILGSLAAQVWLVTHGVGVLVDDTGAPPPQVTRLVRFFSYFTVQANLMLAFVAATLLLRPHRDGPVWRVVRLDALLGIAVTGVVFVVALRPILDLHGLAAVTNAGFHYASPVLGVVGWLLFGPRPRIGWRTVGWSLAWPVAWLAYTLVHGAATRWWPYPFVDAHALGYPRVAVNCAVVTVLFLALAALARLVDRRLPPTPAAADEGAEAWYAVGASSR